MAFLLLSAVSARGQSDADVRAVLDAIVAHAQSSSLYRDRVDWEVVRAGVRARAERAATVPQLADALGFLFESLGDEHGRVLHDGQVVAYHFGGLKPHQALFDAGTYGRVQGGQDFPFAATLVDGDIGYVRLAGLPMGDNRAMARVIEEAVCGLADRVAGRWIVDLRYNGGGNLHPMAEGLAQLIGEGPVGGTEGLTPAECAMWRVSEGDFLYDDQSIRLDNGCRLASPPRVAVLTSLYTASSGEALAVVFKGRADTRFFGGRTLGLTTVTDWLEPGPSTAATISVGYFRDRDGKVYRDWVDVDEECPFMEAPLGPADDCVARAIAWLRRGG
jgi:hypothetical protein